VALTATTLAGFLAERWWVLELLSNLRPQHMIALATLALILLALRRPGPVVLATVAFGINLVVMGPVLAATTFGEPAQAPPDAPTLDITFFNTKIIHADMERTVAALEERADDVVVLAGATPTWVERLRDADLGLHVLLGPHTHQGLELIVLARDPDAAVAVHQVSAEPRDVFVEVVVELEGQPVRVLGAHVVSPLTPERATRRDAMLAWIPGWVERGEDPGVIVGDLNATPWSPVLTRSMDDAELVDSQVGHGLQPSYPASLRWLGLPIDHVLHTGRLTTLDRRLGPALGSDHRMVHATLAVRGGDD
jgi:endonuclease/exonuclease/phosphatase (EEP) superfamily protein YafD